MKTAAALLSLAISVQAASPDIAASAINQLGIDLHKHLPPTGNVCISPYSIQSALAMTFAGADGATREETQKVLHYPKDAEAIHDSLAALRTGLDDAVTESAKVAQHSRLYGGPTEPIILDVANRLFGQKGYNFREEFTSFVGTKYVAPFAAADYRRNAAGATRVINDWVAFKTRKHIRDLIPARALNADTRLVLANALYLKAPWANDFNKASTKPEPFHIAGGAAVNVPTMNHRSDYRYVDSAGFIAAGAPFSGGGLQLVVIIPKSITGLADIEPKLTSEILAACATAKPKDVNLHLPKFKIETPTVPLGAILQTLGMKSAFDKPQGSANFDGIAPRKPDDYLFISEVFHKTFIALDEKGAEAAAATAASLIAGLGNPIEEPIEVKVNRPFIFAIQHVPSGACLFLGRVSDPR